MRVLFATLVLCSASLTWAKNIAEKPVETAPTTPSATPTESKLAMRIYYESLCPDSRKLLNDLGREYHMFKKYIALEFVPFGRAKSLDVEGNEFKCHHGPKECVSNLIHSCGIKHLTNQDAKQQFVVCQMNAKSEDNGKEVRWYDHWGRGSAKQKKGAICSFLRTWGRRVGNERGGKKFRKTEMSGDLL